MCSQVTSTRVISTNYPQAARSHGPHRPSACITTYPHPRQSFLPVLRVADGPNLRDSTAGCNLHPAWNEAMCTIGPDSHRTAKRRGRGGERRAEVEEAGAHPLLPLDHPSFRRAGSKVTPGVASPWAQAGGGGVRKKERRKKRAEGKKKKRNRLLMPGAYREPVKSGP